MAKLNQMIAIEKQVKSNSYADLTRTHHQIQKPALLTGIARTYRKRDEEGEDLPSESTKVQVRVDDVLRETSENLTHLFDVTATKDWANTVAKADVVIDGKKILEQVPVTYLLFLEKQLTDIHTFIKKLPTLDPAEEWEFDNSQDAYATKPVETTRTKKVPRNHVLADATKEHPAQVQVFTEDVVVGYWRTVKYSGALPATRIRELLERVELLQTAVKFAREEANGTEVTDKHIGKAVFGYLFA